MGRSIVCVRLKFHHWKLSGTTSLVIVRYMTGTWITEVWQVFSRNSLAEIDYIVLVSGRDSLRMRSPEKNRVILSWDSWQVFSRKSLAEIEFWCPVEIPRDPVRMRLLNLSLFGALSTGSELVHGSGGTLTWNLRLLIIMFTDRTSVRSISGRGLWIDVWKTSNSVFSGPDLS